MYQFYLVLIIILSAFINCFALNDNLDISCEKILEKFNIGYKSFELENKYIEYLAENGYATKETEPFRIMFVLPPNSVSSNMSEEIFGINSVLRGTQLIFDNYIGLYNNVERPINENINEFLNKVSKCIPDNIKCSKGNNAANRVCNHGELYRSFDGVCNNLDNAMNGAAFTAYSRLTEAFYDDNILDIRKNWQGYQLNSPRKIVNEIWLPKQTEKYVHINFSPRKKIPNMGWYLFAQLLTHDVASSMASPSSNKDPHTPFRCCSADYKTFLSKSKMVHTCLPFEIPINDKYHQNTNLFCHNFIRHQPIFPNNCKLGPAEQLNQVTHFIDLSVIYSGTNEIAHNLRTMNSGMLKTNEDNILPIKDGDCLGSKCYYTGDWRADQTQSLTLMHLLFVRLHNEIAKTLKEINSQWDDEKLFQESRRLNIAIYQNVVFNEFLPILIGEPLVLSNQYNKTVDPSTTNDFITGVFRSLHIFAPSHFKFYDKDFKITESISMSKMIFETKDYLKTNFGDITRGLLLQRINTGNLEEEIINKLFNESDLISVDIQRGRDHGIAPYWRYREYCGYSTIKKFCDLYPLISKKNIEKLRQVYLSPLDIDIYVGGQLEERGNNLMGPTFNCITRIQFARYAIGDRFFYLHENNPYPFTAKQLKEINKFTFAKLICLLTNETRTPQFSFFIPSTGLNNMIDCSSLKDFDLSDWKDI